MLKKRVSKLIALVLAFILALAPLNAYAALGFDGFMTGIGGDFLSFFGREAVEDEVYIPPQEYNASPFDEEMQSVEVTDSSAIIYLDSSYMTLSVEKYNILLKSWSPMPFEHCGYYVKLDNLKDTTFYKVRIKYQNKTIGKYSFFTSVKNIENLKLEVNEDKIIILTWDNPRGLLTEIFKKTEDSLWRYIGATYDAQYIDLTVEQGTNYAYMLRFVCKNEEALNYSNVAKVSTFVEVDIDEIVNSQGYIVIRQNDEKNRTIPYPYNDNGKTIGTSGCGVCSSLMVIKNTTSFNPTLESYTKALLKAGCRESYGSDMYKIAKYMKEKYNINYKMTKSVDELKAHLDKGYMATAHVGTSRYFTNGSGHFVTVAGYVKGKHGDKAIILDPSYTQSKYTETRRIEAGIENCGNGIVNAPFETLLKDCKGEYFVLFTP